MNEKEHSGKCDCCGLETEFDTDNCYCTEGSCDNCYQNEVRYWKEVTSGIIDED